MGESVVRGAYRLLPCYWRTKGPVIDNLLQVPRAFYLARVFGSFSVVACFVFLSGQFKPTYITFLWVLPTVFLLPDLLNLKADLLSNKFCCDSRVLVIKSKTNSPIYVRWICLLVKFQKCNILLCFYLRDDCETHFISILIDLKPQRRGEQQIYWSEYPLCVLFSRGVSLSYNLHRWLIGN